MKLGATRYKIEKYIKYADYDQDNKECERDIDILECVKMYLENN
jgi:hypothetical protein